MIWAMRHAFGWRGKFLADRYHMRVLKTPREVRSAIRYVLLNPTPHRRRALDELDPASSRRLLTIGWRRFGLLDPLDVPGAAPASPA